MSNRIQMQKTEYRHTMVCIDSYKENIMQGRLYGPYIDGQMEFLGLMNFILHMETVLERMHLPGSGGVIRSFEPSVYEETELRLPEPHRPAGQKGTFLIRILFRQNSSWQGSVLWLEGKTEQSFRSVLELVLLMDSALNPERRAAL